MKRKIILSINPEFSRSILDGTKQFEYRTRVPKSDVSSIIIYETLPVKRIVAEAKVVKVICLAPDDLWAKTKDKSGITKKFFESYFKGRKLAYAYALGDVKVYEEPKELKEFGLRFAPQSFAYVAS